MNEELQKQITEILKKAMESAQKGGEWIGGQVPDVLHQLIVWTITKGVVFFFLTISMFLVSFLLIRKASNTDYEMEEVYGMTGLTIGMVAIVSLPFSIGAFVDALQALVAPKLFLLEYAAHLVK